MDTNKDKDFIKTIEEEARNFRDLIDSTPLCIKIFDGSGKLLFLNRGGRDEHSIKDTEDITKWDWVSTVKNEYRPAVMSAFERALKGEYTRVEMEHVPGMGHAWCSGFVSPIKDDSGKIRKILFYSIDATEKHIAENKLKEEHKQKEMILQASGEGILAVDVEGKHFFVNPAAVKILGYDYGELIGVLSHSLWHYKKADGSDYPREECPIYAAYKDGVVHHGEDDVFWRKDGTSFPVSYTSTPIREEGKLVGAVVSFFDITQRKKTEEDLKNKNIELEQINKAMVGRELKMLELKNKIKELEEKLDSSSTDKDSGDLA